MNSVQQLDAPVQTDPYADGYLPDEQPASPDPSDWAWLCSQTRTLDPPSRRAAYLPAVDWFRCQVSYHRGQSHFSLDYHDLVSTALNDILCVLRDRKCATVADLLAQPGTGFRGVDLAKVAVPREPRTSALAGCLDADVQFYLDMGTDLSRLAAWSILQHADAAEWYGSRSVCDYHDACDAFENASEDVAGEFPENPLW